MSKREDSVRGACPSAASTPDRDVSGAAGMRPTMARLARVIQREHSSVEGTLQAITQAAVGGVAGASSAGITLAGRRGKLENRASTDDLPKRVDALQVEIGEGPCLDALREHRTVRVRDAATDRRWPRFGPRAAELGAVSMLSFQLFVDEDSMGALTLYSADRGAFTAAAEDIGRVFASHAAVALVGAQQEAGLRTALDNRDLIGQAKGILMERYKLSAQQAFLLLVRSSQDRNIKVRDLADQLAATGEFSLN